MCRRYSTCQFPKRKLIIKQIVSFCDESSFARDIDNLYLSTSALLNVHCMIYEKSSMNATLVNSHAHE